MSINIDVFSPPRTSTLKSELEKRVEALEEYVIKIVGDVQHLQKALEHEYNCRRELASVANSEWQKRSIPCGEK